MDTAPHCVHCIVINYIRQHRTPTWCEIVNTLAAVIGVLVSLFQLLKG